MGRSHKLLLGVLVAGLLVPAAVLAGIPDPSLSDVPNVFYAPGGTQEYIVTVNGSSGPIDGATVQLVFSDEADTLIAWCVGQTHPSISATTDINGEAHFFIGAGGCVEPAATAGGLVCEVFANGVKLAEVGAVSSDAVDNAGTLPTSGWVVTSSTSVGLADASFHAAPLTSGTYSYCSDVNSDGIVGLTDATILATDIVPGSGCNIQ